MKATTMNTGVCRASYLNATKPKAAAGSTDLKYSVALLIPKEDTDTIAKIRAAIKAAHEEDKGSKNHLKGIANPKNTLYDGDGLKNDGSAFGPECAGHMVLNCSSKNKPGLVDAFRNPLTDPDEWYSGIFVRANLNFYAYNVGSSKGIAAGLNHLQKVRDGEPLSGGGNANAAFDDGYEPDGLLD